MGDAATEVGAACQRWPPPLVQSASCVLHCVHVLAIDARPPPHCGPARRLGPQSAGAACSRDGPPHGSQPVLYHQQQEQQEQYLQLKQQMQQMQQTQQPDTGAARSPPGKGPVDVFPQQQQMQSPPVRGQEALQLADEVPTVCEGCQEHPPVSRCLDCDGALLCEACTRAHVNLKWTREHRLEALGGAAAGAAAAEGVSPGRAPSQPKPHPHPHPPSPGRARGSAQGRETPAPGCRLLHGPPGPAPDAVLRNVRLAAHLPGLHLRRAQGQVSPRDHTNPFEGASEPRAHRHLAGDAVPAPGAGHPLARAPRTPPASSSGQHSVCTGPQPPHALLRVVSVSQVPFVIIARLCWWWWCLFTIHQCGLPTSAERVCVRLCWRAAGTAQATRTPSSRTSRPRPRPASRRWCATRPGQSKSSHVTRKSAGARSHLDFVDTVVASPPAPSTTWGVRRTRGDANEIELPAARVC